MVHKLGYPMPNDSSFDADAPTCATLEAMAWGSYGMCTYLVAVAVGGFAQVANQSSFVNSLVSLFGTSTSTVLGGALKAADPCGYLRDHLIQQYMTDQHCPESTILNALGIPGSISKKVLPSIKQ